ncbi:MAG: sugar phosphate isomerase/epimerase [Abitibacteriaceae bacterium]|nr:sugar phosphate isomerase/epimerase [Abditibacteriaceae bacterium]
MASIPIALQLFSVRGECNDLPATLKAVADIGYQGAEPWGYNGSSLEWQGHHCQEIRRMYDDNGLICCGIHLATDALRGDNLQRTIEFNQTLGNRFLVIAADKQRMDSRQTILELAQILNEAAEQLQPHGMFSGYHAHGFDFATIDGEIAWDILFSNTRPEVIMQLDIGNCAGGGGDPIGTLRKFPGRARSVHLKDFGGPEDSVIGEGQADWPEIFRLCETTQNTEWYVVEEGSQDGHGFDISRRSLENLRRMGK